MQTSQVEDGYRRSPCRSRLKHPILICATVGLFLTIGLSMSVLISYGQRSKSPKVFDGQTSALNKPAVKSDDSVCVTPGCVLAAAKIIENMDKNIDPCEDFYSFACGGFNAPIPENQLRVDSNSFILYKVTDQLRVLFEKPIKINEAEPFQLVKKYYQSCMNPTRPEKLEMETLKILQEFGGWPVVLGDKWNDTNFAWDEMIYNFYRAGYSTNLINLSVDTDLKNSTSRVIFLEEPTFSTQTESDLEYKIYRATQLGADEKIASKQLTEAYEFGNNLTAILQSLEKSRDDNKLYNPMTINKLQAKVPGIPWLKFINNILEPHHFVTETETVIVTEPEYFIKLSDLLAKTSKRTLANYLMWRVSDISEQYWEQAARNEWKECTEVVTKKFPVVVGAMYVRKYFDENARHSANEIVNDIRSVFTEIINEIDWLDNKTRTYAQKKLAAITSHIGYPVELLDDKKLMDLYKNLTLSSDDFVGNTLNLIILETNQSLKKLRQPINKTDWITHGSSAVVNALYDVTENSIEFPASILQGVYFSKDRPSYLNYAAIGWAVGHEITHGFDDKGCQYCAKGNLFDWWEQSTKQKYLKLAKCFIDQYGNYTIPEIGMKIDGFRTQGENIADNGGIKQAYRAYIKWSNRRKTGSQNWDQVEQRLPGLPEYNVRQLFWLGATNVYCGKVHPRLLKFNIMGDPHSPLRFRVHGSFANMPQFASDYNCPVGSVMNPVKKCNLW